MAEPLLSLMADILVKNTSQSHEQVLALLNTGALFGSQEALKMGLIDTIASEPVFPQTP